MGVGADGAVARSPRVVAIGLDAFDPKVALEWIESGDLPNLRALHERAAWGRTANPIGMIGAVWPTLATGTSPARHGRHYKTQIRPGDYASYGFCAHDVKEPPFWSRLGAEGRRSCIADVPMIEPPTQLNGIHLADWGSHEAMLEPCRSWPPELAADVQSRFGDRPLGPCYGCGSTVAAARALVEHLETSIATKLKAFRYLLARERWDFFFGVLSEAHCIGENCWHIMDAEHPHHDAAACAELGNPILTVYRALDAAVGELLEGLETDATVLVLASHSMASFSGATDLLTRVLDRLEAPAERPRVYHGALRAWRRLPVGLRRLLPERYRRSVKARLAESGRRRLRVFELLNDAAYGAIRINLAGREPEGVVAPGAQLDALCSELRARLLELVDADTGEPAVREVHRTRELYSGPQLDALPDLFVEWSSSAPLCGVRSERLGEIRGSEQRVKTGNHRADNRGLLWAAGPGIEPGPLGRDLPAVDFAPTVASLLGVSLPDVDGVPIPELLGHASRRGRA